MAQHFKRPWFRPAFIVDSGWMLTHLHCRQCANCLDMLSTAPVNHLESRSKIMLEVTHDLDNSPRLEEWIDCRRGRRMHQESAHSLWHSLTQR